MPEILHNIPHRPANKPSTLSFLHTFLSIKSAVWVATGGIRTSAAQYGFLWPHTIMQLTSNTRTHSPVALPFATYTIYATAYPPTNQSFQQRSAWIGQLEGRSVPGAPNVQRWKASWAILQATALSLRLCNFITERVTQECLLNEIVGFMTPVKKVQMERVSNHSSTSVGPLLPHCLILEQTIQPAKYTYLNQNTIAQYFNPRLLLETVQCSDQQTMWLL